MDKETETLIELKYGPLGIGRDYIQALPAPVSKKLNNGWPFITARYY